MIQYYDTSIGRFGNLHDVYNCMRIENLNTVVIYSAVDWLFENVRGLCGTFTFEEISTAVLQS